MRGLPGSGKSTLAGQIYDRYDTIINSTDDYWLRPDNFYDFNYKRLGEAHAWNLDQFKSNIEAYKNEAVAVLVDNTNITFKDCKPYIDFALSNNYRVYLVEPDTEWAWDVDECFKRNTHRVPLESIKRMKDKWEPSSLIKSNYPENEVSICIGEKDVFVR
jgi:2',3'-cyclic-nucleotide 3'-phosphodiesterase